MLILELLGVFGAQTPLQIKTTLMTEPLVNSALAQFMYKNLLSPETVSWEQFDYCKGLQHVLQPLSSSFAKTSSSTIRIPHSRKSLLGSWIASRLSLT